MDIQLKAAEYSADLEALKETDTTLRNGVLKFKHSHLLGSYDDTEMEPCDEYFFAREIEPKQPQPLKNEPLLF